MANENVLKAAKQLIVDPAMTSLLPVRLYDRENPLEFTDFEWRRIQDFHKAVSERRTDLLGYSISCRDRYFCLVPLPHLAQVYVSCVCDEVPPPPENAFVSIKGKWINRLLIEGQNEAASIFLVHDIRRENDQLISSIRPEIGFNDFKEHLFGNWQNVDPFVAEYLSLELVSSPALLRRTGGIKNTLYSLGSTDATIHLQQDILDSVWEDVRRGEIFKLETPLGEIMAGQYNWSLYVNSIDEKLPVSVARVLSSLEMEGHNEISVGLASKHKIPKNMSELPVVGTDICTLLNEDASRIVRRIDSTEDPFTIQKYMITMHMYRPIVDLETSQHILQIAEEKISELPKMYALSPQILGRNSFLNINYWGKPWSIIRLALSESRTRGQKTLDLEIAKQVLNDFLKNFDDLYNAWEEEMPKENDFELVRSRLTLNERRIWRHIDQKGPKSPKELGEELGFSELELDSIIDTLYNRKGVIYRVSDGKY